MPRACGLSLVLVLGALVAGCSGAPDSGPAEVKWDRDQCERCRMVVSDPRHAAQIRQPAGEGRSKVYRFDDFGCAVIWLDQQAWKGDAAVEFWVTDHRTREWIDATRANYVMGQITPMAYGLGAQADPAEQGLSYSEARSEVYRAEEQSKFPHQHHPVVEEVDSSKSPRNADMR